MSRSPGHPGFRKPESINASAALITRPAALIAGPAGADRRPGRR
ncbi:hypothetical protein [Micromonospora sp. BL4]|nr:hypothetical protein [Micromonospora sp. BL4]